MPVTFAEKPYPNSRSGKPTGTNGPVGGADFIVVLRCEVFSSVGLDVGGGKLSSREFGVEQNPGVIPEFMAFLRQMEKFVVSKILIFGHAEPCPN